VNKSKTGTNLVAVATLLLAAVDSPGMQTRIAPEEKEEKLIEAIVSSTKAIKHGPTLDGII
jgi:hypothetical protein